MVKVSTFAPLVMLAVLGLAPAAEAAPPAKKAPAREAACAPTLSQTFLDWRDRGWYTLATGGSMESSDGWTLSDAELVPGNEPWYVTGTEDSQSLSLPSGATATSPFMCISKGFPYFRMFVKNTGATSSKLKVEVIFKDASGATKVKPAARMRLRDSDWRLSRRLSLASGRAKRKAKDGAATEVAFRFTTLGDAGKWRIDDLYVDPRRR